MKQFLTILFIISHLTSSAQKYSLVIKDSAIINFMQWLFQNDSSFKSVKQVNNKIVRFHSDNFIYTDSSVLNTDRFSQNIFRKENNLNEYFNAGDANYFAQQINQQFTDKWQLSIKRVMLLDSIKLINNRVDNVVYSYSLPLFSVDNKYTIIIEAFFCGLVCGGGEYNLYERGIDNTWKRIKSFNKWAE
ncbi:hypothetical protein ESA94_10005 [Lacibacter luteus]|uniref:Uncharacterized protein n=1 Tax=Lacibacter luteus TaxID=2508719 RepID=A0A4Q1CK60_9BACT|nr:hypothetical protein [Lacibacter luteus]RXK60787.1 hypothetical protein ESA94_10005 [Lacibacter luteus]